MTAAVRDWGLVMEAVALEVMGQPPTRYTHELRYGSHGSLVVHASGPRAGHWRSWEDDVGGGVLDFLRYKIGLDRKEAWAWLQERRLVDNETAPQRPSTAPEPAPVAVPPNSSGQTSTKNDHRLLARDLWTASEQIPPLPGHPARRWMANRCLWRPELAQAGSVRWIPATNSLFRELHQGIGSIAVLMTTPSAWEATWPEPPEPAAVHLVSIDADGMPALDRPEDHTDRGGNPRPGLGKRVYGSTTGTVAIIGNPDLEAATAPARVVEGLADGLALAARFEGPAIISIGTPARLAKDIDLVAWLARAAHGVVIHADADDPGQNAARALRRALQDAGAQVRAVLPPEGSGKDCADIARNTPFPPLSESWVDCADKLTAMHPTWPRWEVARQSSIATEGGHDDLLR